MNPRAWWLCPNAHCDHGSILHDVYDAEDETPRCCVEGCDCGKAEAAAAERAS